MMPASHLSELFFESAQKWPDQPAVQDGNSVVTYRELKERALRLSTKISRECAGDSGLVAFECRRGLDAYVSVLAILAAGKTYLPLSLSWPEKRREAVLKQARPGMILGAKEIAESSNEEPARLAAPAEHAYLLFTSGSTGEPKGIAIRQSQITSYLAAISKIIALRESDRVSQAFDLGFDLSVHDLFTTWSAGACLVHINDKDLMMPAKTVNDYGLTVWFSTPSVVTRAVRSLMPMPALRETLFCGEGLPSETAEAWRRMSPAARLHNIYGPTETTVGITCFTSEAGSALPLGQNGLVPVGTILPPNEAKLTDLGELCLRGPQVIETYFGSKKSFPGGWYPTGDKMAEGRYGFEFLGRLDDQIKLRGYRVELNEIDQILRDKSGIRVLTLGWPAGPAPAEMIFSFIEKPSLDPKEKLNLIESCRQSLPEYMVPFDIIAVHPFPLTANGKTDRAALLKIAGDSLD